MPTPSEGDFIRLQELLRGRYSLDQELGRGGMGAVFLARDLSLDRPVAIKLLLPHLAHDLMLRERFLREARTAAQLMHPNIAPIYSVEEHGELVFFVMGFIAGETLAQRVRRAGPLSADEVAALMRDVAWALAYAHGRGVVHRDIKPDNILLESESGRAIVADFGIAQVNTQNTLTDAGAFVGTAEYMSREQGSALPVDGRSDLYSLGASVYFALVGESPVRAPSLPAVLGRLMREESPNTTLVRPDLSATFADILARTLVRERDSRVASAEVLVSELRALDRARPSVRSELKSYLSDLSGVENIAAAGIGIALLATVTWDLGFIERTTRDGFAVVGIGLLALALVLLPVGLMVLRSQGVSLREIQQGLESEARDATQLKRDVFRRAFGGTTASYRRGLRWTGLFNMVTCSAYAFFAGRFLLPDDKFITFALALSACLTGFGIGAYSLWVSFKSAAAVERAQAEWVKPPLKLRIVGGLANHPLIRRWWKGGTVPTPAVAAPSGAPTATLLLQRVEDLAAQLPDELRKRLPDLLPAAARLEQACSTLRAKVEQLDLAMAELPVGSPDRADFATARNRVAARLADGVSALETLRTDLLRLSVGIGHADGLTIALENAKELGAAIDAELHGHDEVRKLLR